MFDIFKTTEEWGVCASGGVGESEPSVELLFLDQKAIAYLYA
jgi:hypothetical protein